MYFKTFSGKYRQFWAKGVHAQNRHCKRALSVDMASMIKALLNR